MSSPVNVKSLEGSSYFVTYIDDAYRKVWAYPMRVKKEVFEIFQNFHVGVKRETKKMLKCFPWVINNFLVVVGTTHPSGVATSND